MRVVFHVLKHLLKGIPGVVVDTTLPETKKKDTKKDQKKVQMEVQMVEVPKKSSFKQRYIQSKKRISYVKTSPPHRSCHAQNVSQSEPHETEAFSTCVLEFAMLPSA